MADEFVVSAPWRDVTTNSSSIDAAIAWLADRQHGVIGLWQLLDAGISRRAAAYRVRRGRLIRLHHGVYAVGHRRLTQPGWWMAAVLRMGPDAALSHRSAAALANLPGGAGGRPHVSCPRRLHQPVGIAIHHAALPADERDACNGIPTTTVARTLLDLAATASPEQFTRALNDAEKRGLSDRTSLPALLARYPRHRGAVLARAGCARLGITLTMSRSEMEVAFLRLLGEWGLPEPEPSYAIQIPGVRSYEADFAWPRQRLLVELDSYEHHSGPSPFVEDRVRDRELKLLGWDCCRVSADDLESGRERLRRHLSGLLALPSGPPGGGASSLYTPPATPP